MGKARCAACRFSYRSANQIGAGLRSPIGDIISRGTDPTGEGDGAGAPCYLREHEPLRHRLHRQINGLGLDQAAEPSAEPAG